MRAVNCVARSTKLVQSLWTVSHVGFYDSVVAMFHVYLLPTPNLSAHGECLLQVSSRELSLFDCSDPTRCITHWPLGALRRFGREGSRFTIESGRSPTSVQFLCSSNTWFLCRACLGNQSPRRFMTRCPERVVLCCIEQAHSVFVSCAFFVLFKSYPNYFEADGKAGQ